MSVNCCGMPKPWTRKDRLSTTPKTMAMRNSGSGRPRDKKHGDDGDPAASGAHVLHEQVDVGDRELRTGQAAERAAADERRELHASRADAAGLQRRRVLARCAHAQAEPMARKEDMQRRHSEDRDVEQDRLAAEQPPDDGNRANERDVDRLEAGDGRIVERAGDVEDRAQQERRQACRQDVDGDGHDDRVAAAP